MRATKIIVLIGVVSMTMAAKSSIKQRLAEKGNLVLAQAGDEPAAIRRIDPDHCGCE